MKIKNITLNNYRLYKGGNNLSFSIEKNKNIYLISGQNGFGKTTFLHSLLWCLYGKLIVEIDDSIRKDVALSGGYNSFLQKNLNIEQRQILDNISDLQLDRIRRYGYDTSDNNIDGIASYFVSIEFADVFIPSIPCNSLKVTRKYDVVLEKESVEILIDGNINELSNEIGSDMFINDFILNKDIARFFFFDSEKIVALAESNTVEEKRRLSSAYNEVLGVKKYEDLKKNLENLRIRFRKKSNDIENRNKLTLYLEKQSKLTSEILVCDENIAKYEENLCNLNNQNEKLQISLLREGNKVSLSELKRLERVVEVTKEKDVEYKLKLKTFLEYAPFAISGKLFRDTKVQLDNDFTLINTSKNINNQNELIADITTNILHTINSVYLSKEISLELQLNIQSVMEKYRRSVENNKNQLINISEKEYHEFISVFNNITTTYKSEFERLADDYRKNKQALERASRQIANMQNQESDFLIKDIRKNKNIVEKEIQDTETQIRLIYEAKGTISKDLATINKLISELSKKVSLDDCDIKKDTIAQQLIKELDIFLSSLKQHKKYTLESRIRATLNMLMHKEDFIGSTKVQIIDDGIDIDLYSPDGSLIRKESLSKGEQQLYATSILKALVDESGIEFPVFIDSPLQKFDKSHSNKIISEFYPTVSKQVILFPLLHKELTDDELNLMKPLIKSVYLIMNENSHSYFKEIDVELLMK